VVADVLIHQALQVTFIQNDDMVEQIAVPRQNCIRTGVVAWIGRELS
jgi:hypothetical protein